MIWQLFHQWWFWVWVAAGGFIAFVVYAAIITRYMQNAAFALGYDVKAVTLTWWDRVLLSIDHWKVVIFAWLAVLSQVFYYVNASDLSTWASLPWASVFNQRVAGIITITCTLLIPLAHSMQYAKAAETPPVNK